MTADKKTTESKTPSQKRPRHPSLPPPTLQKNMAAKKAQTQPASATGKKPAAASIFRGLAHALAC
jgi:hypothetical protein